MATLADILRMYQQGAGQSRVGVVGQGMPSGYGGGNSGGRGSNTFGSIFSYGYRSPEETNAFLNAPGGPMDIVNRLNAQANERAKANAFRPYQMPGTEQRMASFGSMLNDPGLWSGMQNAMAHRRSQFGGG